jgi:hypothetical protein
LDRPAQLNCQMDHQAKRLIWDWNPHDARPSCLACKPDSPESVGYAPR